MKVVFSERAYAGILAETTEKIKTETGGLFLGTVIDDVWYVIEAIDPGPKSIFEVAYFEYDQKYTQHLIRKIANLYEKKLDLIGLWHRHPGSFDRFSTTDNGTNAKYASMRECGAISALVNIDPGFRLTVYHVGQPYRYSIIPYEVGNRLIPDELLRYKTPDQFIRLMDNILNSTASSQNTVDEECHRSVSFASFLKLISPELAANYRKGFTPDGINLDNPTQERILDEIVEDISFLADEVGAEVALTTKNGMLVLYQDSLDSPAEVGFVMSESLKLVFMSYKGAWYVYRQRLFKESFAKAKLRKSRELQTQAKGRTIEVRDSLARIIRLTKKERQDDGHKNP